MVLFARCLAADAPAQHTVRCLSMYIVVFELHTLLQVLLSRRSHLPRAGWRLRGVEHLCCGRELDGGCVDAGETNVGHLQQFIDEPPRQAAYYGHLLSAERISHRPAFVHAQSDGNGTAFFGNLTQGVYQISATANSHSSASTVVSIIGPTSTQLLLALQAVQARLTAHCEMTPFVSWTYSADT